MEKFSSMWKLFFYRKEPKYGEKSCKKLVKKKLVKKNDGRRPKLVKSQELKNVDFEKVVTENGVKSEKSWKMQKL